MTDEVTRLRRLRKTALKVRALASFLNSSARNGGRRDGVHDRARVLHWHIARIATGRLRSHPYQSYQNDQGLLETGIDLCAAYLGAALARVRGQGMHHLLGQFHISSRELDDTRALTLSAELSDALGRAQVRMRGLIEEVRGQLPAGSVQRSMARGHGPQASSPYLAI